MIGTIRAFVEAILIQQTRDRTSFFFMIVLPLAIIVIIGASFGGVRDLEIAVLGEGTTADAVVEALDATPDVEAVRYTDIEEVRSDIRRFDIEAAVIVTGDNTFEFISNPATDESFAARSVVQRVVDRVEAGVSGQSGVSVSTQPVGEARFASQGAFALTAAQNLVLFTFITALTASSILVRMRRSGVLRRSLSSPASPVGVVTGVGAGWMALAVIQAIIIVAVGALAFSVNWGSPVAALLLVLLFSLVGTGAGLLVGSALSSEDTATSVSIPVALILAALGGCMVPSEIFPDFLATVSKATPHYWALEGWKELMFDGAGAADIATQLVVLTGFAVVLLGTSAVVLRRSLLS